MTQKIWRGGMIGAGAWSEIQLNAWKDVTNAEIVALCDRHPDRRDPVVAKFNIPRAFDDFETMLDQAELDFVDICTRPYSHVPLAKLAVKRGLPVLCQKPFCESIEAARDLVEFCDRAGVRLMINENFRWQAWYRKIKELLDSDMLGTPFYASIHWRRRMTLPEFENVQAYFKEMQRFAVYEVGVHYLDTFRFLFGEPETIFARLHRVSPHIKGEDVQVVTVGYQDLTCVINNSFASVPIPGVDIPSGDFHKWNIPHRLELDGTKGTLILKPDGTLHLYSDTDHEQWTFPSDSTHLSRTAAQQHFIDCLRSGAEFETDGRDTLKTMALVYATYRSAEEGMAVAV